jgi:MFS family permease
LPRAVIALGVVSLLTDVSSEMIYPLLPAFLVTLGAGGAFVGLVDGLAETVAAFLKLGSGYWADRLRRNKPLVVVGYVLAALARPLVAVARVPWHVLAIRTTDRIGKGLRSSPRDAMLAAAAPPGRRGAAFGFHRAMDHAGALVGPLVAYALIEAAGLGHRAVFALAAIPGFLAVYILIRHVREPDPPTSPSAESLPSAVAGVGGSLPRGSDSAPAESLPSAVAGVGGSLPRGSDDRLPPRFFAVLGCLALFTLGNASDLFLLLRAHELGVPATAAPLLWALLHAVKSGLSTPFSTLSDRLGRKRVILAGWGVYALAYAGFAVATAEWHAWALFVLYGAHFALSEGSEKALVADLAPPGLRGRAFGHYHFTLGICLLPASLGFGLVWDHAGHAHAFLVAAGLALAATAGLALTPTRAAA